MRADRRRRRILMWCLVLVAGVGGVLVLLVQAQASSWAEWFTADPARSRQRVTYLVWALAAAFILPTLALSAYLWLLGSRVVESGRFPPRGMPVLRDTVVVFGAEARWRGRVQQVLAGLLGIAVAGFAVLLWRLLALLPILN